MSEKFNFVKCRDSFPGHFFISAILHSKKLHEINQSKTGEHTIEFKINGIDVPFMETLNTLWERANSQLDSQAREMAKEMVTKAGLNNIHELFEKFEYDLIDAIDKVKLKNN